MKGHLDIAELEKYKKTDIQTLAKELGVSTEGTIKEIAVRCAAVEVEVPDKNELTEGEKAAAKTAEEEATAKLDEKVAVRAIQDYHDLQLRRIVETGEQLEVDKDRAAMLINLKLVTAK